MLTGPGGPAEIVEDEVLGERMRVFKDRKRSLRELLLDSAALADKPYIVLDGRRLSYAEHLRQVAAMARVLRDRFGVSKGDRVAILAENHPEWIITFWATVSLGGIVAALNGWWTTDEIRYALELTEPKVLVADRKRLQRLAGSRLDVPTLEMEVDSGSRDLILDERFMAVLGVDPAAPNVKRVDGKDETDHEYVRYFATVPRELAVPGTHDVSVPAAATVMFQKIIHDGLVGHAFLSAYTTTYDLAGSTMIFAKR